MSSSKPPRPGARVRPALIAVVYLFVSLVWRLGVEIVVGLGIAVWALSTGIDPSAIEDIFAFIPPWVLAASSSLQLFGLAVLAALAAWAAGWDVRRSLGLVRPPVLVLFIGFFGVVGSSIFSGWLAELLRRLLPRLELGSLEMINDALTQGPMLGRVLMLATICIAAPLFEELVFRGFLWDAFSRAAPWWVAWLLTSVIFGLYHIDPVQALAVIPIGLFLGWLRHASGSVWPPIAAHFANNSLAAVLVYTVGDSPEGDMPIWGALLAALFTIGAGGIAWIARKERS